MIGQLGYSNNPLCMISRLHEVLNEISDRAEGESSKLRLNLSYGVQRSKIGSTLYDSEQF